MFISIRHRKGPVTFVMVVALSFYLGLGQAVSRAQETSEKERLDLIGQEPEYKEELSLQLEPPAEPAGSAESQAGKAVIEKTPASATAVKESSPVPALSPKPETPPAAPTPTVIKVGMTKEELMKAAEEDYAFGEYARAVKKWAEALKYDPSNRKVKNRIKDAEARIEAASARTVARPVQAEPAKSKGGWFRGWFSKETGVSEMSVRPVLSVKPAPKESFGTMSLDDCIKIAAKNNLQLQVAEKSMKLAGMRVFEAQRNMLPSATIAYEEYSGRVQGRAYIGRKQYIEGQQPVFDGGGLFFTLRQAEVNREITRNDYGKIKNEMILQVKKGYYTLAKAKDNFRLQEELAQEVDRIYEMVKKEAEFGLNTRLELLNVTSQKSQVHYQLVSADGDVSVAELILKQTMSLEPDDEVSIAPKLDFKKIEIDYGTALTAAMNHRPEIKINLLMMDYYKYGVNIAKAKGWPKIDLLGSWGLAKEEYTPEDTLGPNANAVFDMDAKLAQQWYAGIKTSMPFWGSTGEYSWTKEQWVPVVSAFQGTEAVTNSYKLKILDKLDYYSDKQLAEVDLERSRQEFVKIKQDVTLEVKEGCFSYEKALVQLDTATNKVKYQSQDLEVNRLRRGLDEIQDSNVVESMIKLAQEKFGYVQALTDCHISVATINKAIGVEGYFKDEQ